MEYKLGDKKVHPYGGEKEGHTIVVAILNTETKEYELFEEFSDFEDLKEFLEEEACDDVIFFAQSEWDAEYLGKDEIESAYAEDESEVLWQDYITEEEFKKRKEVSDKIIKLLKENDINTSDLIVSDGKVYQGYGECANYIQATHAWCSSSMSC